MTQETDDSDATEKEATELPKNTGTSSTGAKGASIEFDKKATTGTSSTGTRGIDRQGRDKE